MCGICGKLSWNSSDPVDESFLKAMNRAMTHRGPDAEGYFIEAFSDPASSGSIGLAMRRLAIIDLSNWKPPMTDDTDDISIL